jgi:transposase-like protein
MSRTRTVYSAEFKTRLVLELLKEDKTEPDRNGQPGTEPTGE